MHNETIKIRKVDNEEKNDMVSFPPDLHERPKSDFTCFQCPQVDTCPSRYHWYNIDDCIALK